MIQDVKMKKLENKVALITGAGRGIGRSIALKYAEEGANLFLCATRLETLEETKKLVSTAGVKVELYPLDIRDRGEVEKMVKQAIEQFGRIDILVNNAGIYRPALFQDYKMQDFDDVMKVNVYGTFNVTQFVLRQMLTQQSGTIINIASTAGKWASFGQSAYNMSKHAVVGMTRCIAQEVGGAGITVNAICPGVVETDVLADVAKVYGIEKEQIVEGASQRAVLNRIIQPDEVAGLALYLASDEAAGITGQSILLDGGMVFV
jgi:NAD(P)-dependent dehydrogenase (short-subunit alcohol dehydrogenase family)